MSSEQRKLLLTPVEDLFQKVFKMINVKSEVSACRMERQFVNVIWDGIFQFGKEL